MKLDQIFSNYSSFLIISSQPLDFDCIGSGLVLKKYLESLGKKVSWRFPREIKDSDREYYSFLPYFDELEIGDTREALSQKNHDVLIMVDGSNLEQFYDSDKKELPAPDISIYDVRVHIDNHQGQPEKLGTEILYDRATSSVVELILRDVVPVEFLDKDLALVALAGIYGDTGIFQWNYFPNTFRIVAQLLEKGANPDVIIDRIAFSKSRAYFEALGYVINHLEYRDDLKSSFLFLPYSKLSEENIDEERFDRIKRAFIDSVAAKTPEYPLSFVMYEKEPGKITISARGNNFYNKVNLPEFFKSLGSNGGGHFNASGMKVAGEFEGIKNRLIDSLSRFS